MADDDLRECLNRCSGYYAEHHFTEPQVITCKWCGSDDVSKYGTRDGVQDYICNACGRKFNTKDAPAGMRTPVEQIGASLNLYYTGSSLTDVANHLAQVYNNPVNRTTIYAWLLKYSVEAVELLSTFKPQRLSNIWLADETAIKFDYDLHWIWDVIDRDTRFLLASYLSPRRGTQQARILMELALEQAERPPKKVITDKLRAYIDGIELVFGSDTVHIQSSPFADSDSTNIIERFQGTIKERTKVLWGFKTVPAAKIIIGGFVCHYNFFRPHIALDNLTPAEVAGTDCPIKTWTDLVRMVG